MIMDDLKTKEESKKKGKIVLFSLISFFAVFSSVDAYFVYKAVSTHSGMVTENPYEKGLAYNQVIEKAKSQKALNITSDTTYKNGALTTVLKYKNGDPILGATVVADLVRNVHKGNDFQKILQYKGDGVYQSNLNLSLKGTWTVNLDIKWEQHNKQKHYQTTSIITN